MEKKKYTTPFINIINVKTESVMAPCSWGVNGDDEDNSHLIEEDNGTDPDAKGNTFWDDEW